jgi:chorismate-pyruvate lyase
MTPGYDGPQTVPLPLELWGDERTLPRGLTARYRSWLVEDGLLSQRMRADGAGAIRLDLIGERVAFLSAEQQRLLKVASSACFERETTLCSGARAWVYSQTLIPDAALELSPWLAALGSRELEATLCGLPALERGTREYALLPASHPLIARALNGAQVAPDALWARRTWHALHGQRFLIQEVYLPALGRS